MAAQHLEPTTQTRLASTLQQMVADANRLVPEIILIKYLMDNMIAGSDYTQLETRFGLPTGQGQTVYNLVAGAWAQLGLNDNSGSFNQMRDRLG